MALLAPWAANAQDNNTIVLDGNKNIAIQAGQSYTFYDSRGPNGNYGRNENYTLTLTCFGKITIRFSEFQTEASTSCGDYDYMLIYDGEVSDGRLITRGQSGCINSLGTGYIYEATSGTMTIVWKSDWSGDYEGWVATITGVCGPVVVNENSVYTENFDSYTAGTYVPYNNYPNDPLPQCWQFLNRSDDGSSYPTAFINSNSSYAVNGNCLFFMSEARTSLYAILPEFEKSVAHLQITFTYRNEGTDENNGTLYVGYMTDLNDTTTFVPTLECPKTTTLTPMTAYFPQAPQVSYMAFKYKHGGGPLLFEYRRRGGELGSLVFTHGQADMRRTFVPDRQAELGFG